MSARRPQRAYWWVSKLTQHDLKLGVPKQRVSSRELKPLETIEASQALHYRYRDSSQIQFTSQLFPPSAENDCSMRADWGEISDQT